MSGFPFTPSENISSSTTTTALPVEAKVDVETDTTSSTITTTPIPPAPSRGHNSQRQLGITEVSFSMAVTGTSTKTDNKGKMFTVYNTKVSALGIRWVVPKRFSELELLNDALRKRYPQSRLPKFPSKGGLGGLFRRLDDSTIEKRRSDLQTYLDGALANYDQTIDGRTNLDVKQGEQRGHPQGISVRIQCVSWMEDALKEKS